jgi:hypothetical protein
MQNKKMDAKLLLLLGDLSVIFIWLQAPDFKVKASKLVK